MLKIVHNSLVIVATAIALGVAALPALASDMPMPQGCVDPEYYFDVMEYNESAESLGVFGPETGMPQHGELVRVDGVTYDVRFYDDAVCINRAEPHTRYNVSKRG